MEILPLLRKQGRMSLPPHIPAAPGRVRTLLRSLHVWAFIENTHDPQRMNQWICSDPLTFLPVPPAAGQLLVVLEERIILTNPQGVPA